MLKKIIVGLLVVTILGGIAFALLDSDEETVSETLSTAVTATVQPIDTPAAGSSVGQIWSGTGTILDLTTVGMTLALEDGSEVYVELGSPEYWQAQGVALNVGAVVSVDGFFNGTDYHARAVTNADGSVLSLRNEAGQPLWSGGNGNGENGGQGQVQIPADEWVTVDGTVTALTNNGLVIQTTNAQTLTVSFGRADFWQTQEVSFAVGDAISMLGFWQADQFHAGQVIKTTTDERILLRDPNGRPLWAGPGRGQGNGGRGNQTATPEN